MADHEITKVRKKDPKTHLQHITDVFAGGKTWAVPDVVKAIDNKTDTFHVKNGNAKVAVTPVHPNLPLVKPYIRTAGDSTTNDNLLNLLEF